MNMQRILFAVAVLALTVGCTWGATQASDTAGFAVIPDNEAAQIRGGLGWTCTREQWPDELYPCDDYESQEECTYWTLFYRTWECELADSGQCDDSAIVIGFSWGPCVWSPEYGDCWYGDTGYDVPVYGCVP